MAPNSFASFPSFPPSIVLSQRWFPTSFHSVVLNSREGSRNCFLFHAHFTRASISVSFMSSPLLERILVKNLIAASNSIAVLPWQGLVRPLKLRTLVSVFAHQVSPASDSLDPKSGSFLMLQSLPHLGKPHSSISEGPCSLSQYEEGPTESQLSNDNHTNVATCPLPLFSNFVIFMLLYTCLTPPLLNAYWLSGCIHTYMLLVDRLPHCKRFS